MLRLVTSRLSPMARRCKDLVVRYPRIPNTLTTGGLFALGDVAVQIYEGRSVSKRKWLTWLDTERSLRIFGIGVFFAYGATYYYGWLDGRFPGTAVRAIAKKMAVELFIGAPIIIAVFIAGMKYLESGLFRDCWVGLKQEFPLIYKADLCFWSIAQTINFRFVAPQFRMIYVGVISFFWDMILTYLHHDYIEYNPDDADGETSRGDAGTDGHLSQAAETDGHLSRAAGTDGHLSRAAGTDGHLSRAAETDEHLSSFPGG